MNSWNHCLTRIPSDAVMRLIVRLHDQSVLIATKEDCATNDWVGNMNGGVVELMKGLETERLEI